MEFFNRVQSEDLPHVSGIKTKIRCHKTGQKSRKICPTNRGLRPFTSTEQVHHVESEDLPR